jgi:hypothetical protein
MRVCDVHSIIAYLPYTPWAGSLDLTRGEEMFLQL